jgi:arsenate reductase
MAEAFLNKMCGKEFEAQSAGLEPGRLNPVVVEVMREIGIDISSNRTKAVSDILKSGQVFSHVITVCDETSAGRCPVFPGGGARLHWSFADPSTFGGTEAEVLEKTRGVRDAIKQKVEWWCREQGFQADF